jgi:hypothetical protein
MIKGKLSWYFCGRGFYALLFEKKEERDLIFLSGPYFIGTKGYVPQSLDSIFLP